MERKIEHTITGQDKRQFELVGTIMTSSNEICNDLPFYIWIQVINHDDENKPYLIAEYDKNKGEGATKLSTRRIVNDLLMVSIDRETPCYAEESFLINILQDDMTALIEWIKENYDKLIKLWNRERTTILGYPINLKCWNN